MDALVLNVEQKTANVLKVSQPVPGPDEILVRVHAIALNPVDALYTFNPLGSTGRVVGSDFAGTIESRGDAGPAKDHLEVGSRVAGFVQGACSVNDRPGAFAEFVVSPWDLVWQVPETTSFEEAATINLCGLTAAQSVYYRLGLPAPWSPETSSCFSSQAHGDEINVFIYSASTSVAMYAAQLVRHSMGSSGAYIKLFGTASSNRFGMLQSEPYCYDHLVDYHDSNWPEQVKQLAGERGIHYALDCISEGSSVRIVSHLLRKDGRMAIVRSREAGAWDHNGLATSIVPIYGAVWEGLGAEVQYSGFTVKKSPEARAFAVQFYKWLSQGGKLFSNPVRSMPGGLKRIVEDGFTLLGSGRMEDRNHERTEAWMTPVGAEKITYKFIA